MMTFSCGSFLLPTLSDEQWALVFGERRNPTLVGDSFLVHTPHFLIGQVMEASFQQQQAKFRHEQQEGKEDEVSG